MRHTGRICAAILLAGIFPCAAVAQIHDFDSPDELPATDYEYSDGVATDLDALDNAHAVYLKKADLQLERPEAEPEEFQPPKPPPRWLTAFFEWLGYLEPLFKLLFYVVCGAVVIGIAYFLFGEAVRVRLGWKKKQSGSEDDVLPDYRPDASAARTLLEEADALAKAGRFAEAVHLLLFRSIEDIQTRLEGGVPRSLTSREIGGLGYLPDRARKALGPIIGIVEHSFFGGRDVDATGWETARASYQEFAFGEGWS